MITRALLRRDGIWLLLCLIMAWLQFLRGAHAEAAVFAGLPLLLIVDATGGPERLLGDRLPAVSRRLPSRPVLTVVAVLVGVPRAAAPRYSPALAVLIGARGLLAVLLVWPDGAPPERPERQPALDRGRVAWAAVCVAACGFEVSAYLLSRGSATAAEQHPAVSDLVGPLLDTDPGRLAFAAAWVAGGIALLRRGWRAR